ncbi:MAG: sensor domain-containing diguanylate cyclase [Snowella sp.]|nr:sensor domain-containing diguanylate cyclase [Snowella sp.]
MQTILAFANFQEAVQSVLQALHHRLGFQLWMFTRVEGEDWIVLAASDYGYGVKAGDVFRWSDSFCSRMVAGLGPRIAPCSQKVLAYAEAPIGQQVEIAAYIGIPLADPEGQFFGTLCAIDPVVQSDTIQTEQAFIELQTRLLTTILHYELKAQTFARRCERAEAEAQSDILTGIYNRRGWERLLAAEEERCKRFGLSAGVLIIDLDNLKVVNDSQGHPAGDRLIQKAVTCLSQNIRQQDVFARIGGDEFAILVIEVNGELLEDTARRLQRQLQCQDIPASIGWAVRTPQSTLPLAVSLADQAMFKNKIQRKQNTIAITC